jgi:hypothetical protein
MTDILYEFSKIHNDGVRIDYEEFHWIPKNFRPYIDKRIKDKAMTAFEAGMLAETCFRTLGGIWAWISPSGEIFRVNIACHDWAAYEIFGMTVREMESKFGRVTHTTYDTEDKVFKYVDRPTKKQIDAYYKHYEEIKDYLGE